MGEIFRKLKAGSRRLIANKELDFLKEVEIGYKQA
jgi:hypothetical protein